MAKLKQETDQIRYSEQIGVNRGGGFAVAADAQIRTANAWDNLVGNFANFTLQETKEWGKKLGETTAKEYEFGQKEVTYKGADGTDKTQLIPEKVTTPKYLTTATSIEAFEANIYNKYKSEVESSVNNIVLEERTNAENSYATIESFDSIVQERIKPLLENLQPDFKQVITTYANNQINQHGRMVARTYDIYTDKINATEFTANLNVDLAEYNKSLFYGDGTLQKEKLEKLENTIKLAKDNQVVNAVATGDQVIDTAKAKGKIFKLLDGLHITDFENTSMAVLDNTVTNYLKIASLIQLEGPKKVTLKLADGTNKIITKKDLVNASGNNLKTLDEVRVDLANQANLIKSIIGEKADTANITTIIANNINRSSSGSMATTGGLSKDKLAEKMFNANNITTLVNHYNSNFPMEEHISHENWSSDDRFIKWVITTQQVLPPQIKENISLAYSAFNQGDIERLRNSSIITFISNFNHTFTTEIEEGAKFITTGVRAVNFDLLSTLGFDKKTQARIWFIESQLRIDPNMINAVDQAKKHFDKFDEVNYSTVSEALKASSGDKYSLAQIMADVDKRTANILDTLFIKTPSLPLSLSLAVKQEVKTAILSGAVIRNTADLEPIIKSAMKYVVDGNTGYDFSEITYSPFVNMKYSEGDYAKRKHFVKDAAELFYSLPNQDGEPTIEWMKPILMDMVINSPDYEQMKAFKPEIGKNVFLQSTGKGTNVAPKYNLVFVDENGQAQLIQNDMGLPAYYDPSIDYKAKYDKAIIGNTDLENKVNNWKSLREKWIKEPYLSFTEDGKGYIQF